ncbi:MAG: ATP phosphoribosyltransferase regulatory subunit [Anaerolineae bacterium]
MSDRHLSADRPLPEGVRDLLFADAAAFRAMTAALQATWSAWGYREIILPTFEYADTLATDVGATVDAEMYRFFDRHGRTLALRPDMTIPTARVVGTRLYDQPMPLRLAYVGSVFRYEPPRAGRQHEFTQAGVELIGAAGALADAESVALAVAALQAVGLPEFRITVGHVGFFRGLLAALGLPERAAGRLRTAVDRKAEAGLAQLLAEIPGLPPLARNAVLTLPRLTGDAGVLDEAEAICLNSTMMQALSDLRAMADLLAVFGVADRVSYDLAEVRDLDYYTGITFEGFAPGLGFNLISGGRYDELIGHFGPPLAAVGWALTLDRVLLAREMQGIIYPEPRADVLLAARGCAACLQWAAQARGLGLKVELDPLGLAPDALWQAAQAHGIPRAVYPAGEAHAPDQRTDANALMGRRSPSDVAPHALMVRDATGEHVLDGNDWEEVASWLNR